MSEAEQRGRVIGRAVTVSVAAEVLGERLQGPLLDPVEVRRIGERLVEVAAGFDEAWREYMGVGS